MAVADDSGWRARSGGGRREVPRGTTGSGRSNRAPVVVDLTQDAVLPPPQTLAPSALGISLPSRSGQAIGPLQHLSQASNTNAAHLFSPLSLVVPNNFSLDQTRLRRQWRRFNQDVGQYLLHANTIVMERLVKFNREWGFEEFDDEVYYPRTQQLVFSKPADAKSPYCKIQCAGQVLGTYLPNEHAFVWSWADDGFPIQTVAAARFLYNYAQREGRHEHHRLFTLPLVDCSDELANLLCTAACELMGYDGVFRLTTERRGQLFVAFNVRMKERRAIRPE